MRGDGISSIAIAIPIAIAIGSQWLSRGPVIINLNRVRLGMTGTNDSTPDFKDRSAGLIIFGAVSILIGAVCALLVPLSLAAVAFSGSAAGAGVDYRSALSASALYTVMAVVFVWLGVGSILARRWARELLLSISWIWLLTGICTLLICILVVPGVMRQLGAAEALPPELMLLVVLVTIGVIGLLYVVLPGLFVLFYRSPHVAATCRVRHPEPQWIDDCVWVLAAVSVLLMPAYNFFFPVFGAVLTGAAGATLWALVLAVCVALAAGSCMRAPWAWWSGVVLTLAAALSSILTVLRHDFAEIVALLDLPEDQASMMVAMGMPDGWPMALINALVWGTFIVYLMSLRRFFPPASPSADG